MVDCSYGVRPDAASTDLLANALRVNVTLKSLELNEAITLWLDDAHGRLLLAALTGHRSLQKLALKGSCPRTSQEAAAMGASFGSLVAANAPALTELDVSGPYLFNALEGALGPLFDALPRNTHLRHLACVSYDLCPDFVAEHVQHAQEEAGRSSSSNSCKHVALGIRDGAPGKHG